MVAGVLGRGLLFNPALEDCRCDRIEFMCFRVLVLPLVRVVATVVGPAFAVAGGVAVALVAGVWVWVGAVPEMGIVGVAGVVAVV
jgi:hypothetical protein